MPMDAKPVIHGGSRTAIVMTRTTIAVATGMAETAAVLPCPRLGVASARAKILFL